MTKINSHQVEPGALGPNALGNGVDQHDPRGMYGENQSEPTNILGERARPPKPFGAKGNPYGENQLPVPTEFHVPKVQVDERFGVLHQQQIDDEIKIVGLNTLGHHVGSDLKPGAGLPDQAALDALNPIPPAVPESEVRRRQFERQLIAVDQFADNYERTLLELRAIDPHLFDTHYSHLNRTNLPRSVPDPSLQGGFTTFQAALAKVGIQPQPSKVKSMSLEEARALNEANRAMFAERARGPVSSRSARPLTDRYAKDPE